MLGGAETVSENDFVTPPVFKLAWIKTFIYTDVWKNTFHKFFWCFCRKRSFVEIFVKWK